MAPRDQKGPVPAESAVELASEPISPPEPPTRLNALDTADIEYLRDLGGLDRYTWLFRETSPKDRPYHDAFLNDVVDGRQDPHTWGRLGLVCPEGPLVDLLRSPAVEVLAAVASGVDPRWVATLPDRRRWESGNESVGAPGVLRTDITYFWAPPAGAYLIWPRGLLIEPCDEPVLRYRRWLASRVALIARHYSVSPQGLLERLKVGKAELSGDAQRAIHGLANEPHREGQVPGFVGSDADYAG